ncbi:MAG: 11 kDa triple gene block protein 2 [Plant associated potexvirus 1]|nr:MAG: 11 kDa triple gene block protein 2 [Plant associated potexvirus 1]
MPLTPDTQQQTYRTLILCVSVIAAAWALTRSTLPHVGDPSHALPFGGCYRDGTKSFQFAGPRGTPLDLKPIAALVCLSIVVILHALAGRSNNSVCSNSTR